MNTTKQFETIDRQLDQLAEDVGDLEGPALADYLGALDAVAAKCRALTEPHKRALRNAASKASKARRAERIAAGLALLEAQEAGA